MFGAAGGTGLGRDPDRACARRGTSSRSSATKRRPSYCRGLGAELTVDHHHESVGDRLRELTGRARDRSDLRPRRRHARARRAQRASPTRAACSRLDSRAVSRRIRAARDVLRLNCSIVGVFTGAYDRAALDGVFAELMRTRAARGDRREFDDRRALRGPPGRRSNGSLGATPWARSSSSPEPKSGFFALRRAPGAWHHYADTTPTNGGPVMPDKPSYLGLLNARLERRDPRPLLPQRVGRGHPRPRRPSRAPHRGGA